MPRFQNYQERMPASPKVPRQMERKLKREMAKRNKKLARLKPNSKFREKLEGEITDMMYLLDPTLDTPVPDALRVATLMKGGRLRHPSRVEVKDMYQKAEADARKFASKPIPSAPSPQPADPPPTRKRPYMTPDNDEEFMSEMEEILGSLYRDIPSFP